MERSINNKMNKKMNLEQIKINAILAADPEGIQIDGNHYKNDKIPIHKFLSENQVPFLEGNTMKYTFRHKRKNKQKDIAKAIHCLQLLLKDEYNMYMLGGQLYTKEQYDELLSQAKKEAEGKEAEATVIYTDKRTDINRNIYVRKLSEVQAVCIDRTNISLNDLRDMGLVLSAYEMGKGAYVTSQNGKEFYVKYGFYICLSEDGYYQVYSKSKFKKLFEPKQ
jgi:hypothetical protein